jgi:hypothetical protein
MAAATAPVEASMVAILVAIGIITPLVFMLAGGVGRPDEEPPRAKVVKRKKAE